MTVTKNKCDKPTHGRRCIQVAKVGAKGKYEYWLTKQGLLQLWGWAIDGLTDADIANNMGIAEGTLYRWKVQFKEINEALKDSKDIADRAVENALYVKAVMGDNTAMIYWLKNRKYRTWRDRIENVLITEEPIKIQMDYSKLSTDELKALLHLAEKAKIE